MTPERTTEATADKTDSPLWSSHSNGTGDSTPLGLQDLVRTINFDQPEPLDSRYAEEDVASFSRSAASKTLLQERQSLPNLPNQRAYWESFFVVLPVFCGYAALFGLQHEIKVKLGIADTSSPLSHAFGFATSFLYIGNLVMRFAHNIVFGCVSPRE